MISISNVHRVIISKGFKLSSNSSGVAVFILARFGALSVVCVIDGRNRTGVVGDEILQRLQSQMSSQLAKQGYNNVSYLYIIATEERGLTQKAINRFQNYWVLDIKNEELFVTAGAPSDVYGIRSAINDEVIKKERSAGSKTGSSREAESSNSSGGFRDMRSDPYAYVDNYYREDYQRPYMKAGEPRYGSMRASERDYRGAYYTGEKSFAQKYLTPVNTFIVIVNLIVYFIVNRKMQGAESAYEWTYTYYKLGALNVEAILEDHEYWRLFTYMFLHYGTGHIFGNMMVLLFVGDNLERVIGKFRYLIFYILSGIIAGCVSVAYQYYLGNFYVGLGASGAIFGIVGGVTFLAIKNKGRLEDLKGTNLLLFVGLTIFEGLATQEVDNAAHIGGLVAGVVLASILYNSYKKAIAKKYGA